MRFPVPLRIYPASTQSSPTEAFDRLTRLAGRLLRVPVSLVARVEGTRLRLAGQVGAPEWLNGQKMPLARSLTQHVLHTREPLLLRDATADPRFHASPAVTTLGVVAYAGVPLITSTGESLGVFCAVDFAPREWTENDVDALRDLAASATTELEWRTEAAARARSEERYRLMVEGSEQVFFYEHDFQHRFTYLSPSVEAVLGYTPDQLLGRPYEELLTGDVGDRLVQEITERSLREGEASAPYTVTVRHRDGRPIVLELVEGPAVDGGSVTALQGFARDVTAEVEAEEALKESEARFREIAENIREVFWMHDPALERMFYVSPAYEAVWGSSRDEVYDDPRQWLEAIEPEDRPRVEAALPLQPHGEYDIEYRIRRPDGVRRWIRDRAFPIREGDGRILRIVGVAEDVTERKRAEERLRAETERALQAVAPAAPVLPSVLELVLPVPEIGAAEGDVLVVDEAEPEEVRLLRRLGLDELPPEIRAEVEKLSRPGHPGGGVSPAPPRERGSRRGRAPHLRLLS